MPKPKSNAVIFVTGASESGSSPGFCADVETVKLGFQVELHSTGWVAERRAEVF